MKNMLSLDFKLEKIDYLHFCCEWVFLNFCIYFILCCSGRYYKFCSSIENLYSHCKNKKYKSIIKKKKRKHDKIVLPN